MKKPIVSLLQMDVKIADVRHNMEKAAKLFEKAASRRSDFICLPEMWSTGFAYEDFLTIAKASFEDTIYFLSYWAKNSMAFVIGGSIPEPENSVPALPVRQAGGRQGKVYNTSLIFDPSGKQIGSYRKIHIFSPTGEDRHFGRGKKIEVFITKPAKIAVEICYDIRFPELTGKYREKGAKMVFVPAQFPSVRADHWLTLLKARAIENHIFMFGCNRTGKDIHEYQGESVIYDPFGKTVEKASHKEEVLTAQIDLSLIDEANDSIPIEKDRMPEIY